MQILIFGLQISLFAPNLQLCLLGILPLDSPVFKIRFLTFGFWPIGLCSIEQKRHFSCCLWSSSLHCLIPSSGFQLCILYFQPLVSTLHLYKTDLRAGWVSWYRKERQRDLNVEFAGRDGRTEAMFGSKWIVVWLHWKGKSEQCGSYPVLH